MVSHRERKRSTLYVVFVFSLLKGSQAFVEKLLACGVHRVPQYTPRLPPVTREEEIFRILPSVLWKTEIHN
jgi:hypothetical protein